MSQQVHLFHAKQPVFTVSDLLPQPLSLSGSLLGTASQQKFLLISDFPDF